MRNRTLHFWIAVWFAGSFASQFATFAPIATIAEAGEPEAFGPRADTSPRIAIVLSREGVALSSYVPQRTGFGWLGVAALAGVPYATLFVDELGDDGAALANQYGVLVLPEMHCLSETNYERMTRIVRAYREAGGAIVVDGPPGIWNEAGVWRGKGPLLDALDCTLGGFVAGESLRVAIAGGAEWAHFITQGWTSHEVVAPSIVGGFNALIPTEGARSVGVLLEALGHDVSTPWLAIAKDGTSRVVMIGGVFGAGDAASFFRNGSDRFPDPANRVYDILVAALQWTLYGDDVGPIPALQFCAADAAVMIRLDGDHSNRPEDVAQTFSYLKEIAEESGVATAYGIVTGRAEETGWSQFVPLVKRLEESGGEIGTHTHTHDIHGVVDEEVAVRELDESIRAIEHRLTEAGYDPDGAPFLINPNGMIPMTAYGEIASRFPLFLTHGIAPSVPIAYGVSPWFGESDPPFAVIYDSPAPDFQWLYDRDWSYTAEEAAEIQTAIFRHYVQDIKRGVLFDMMWHDYGIASSGYDQSRPQFRWADLFKPARKKSVSNRPLFDALRREFADARVYCPEPLETAAKLRLMKSANYTWSRGDSTLYFTLDLAGRKEHEVAGIAGMGLRVDRAGMPIRSVTINGREHPAFTEDVVILPALGTGVFRLAIRFGSDDGTSRLLYLSKPPVLVQASDDDHRSDLRVSFDAEGVARFTVRPSGVNPCLRGVDAFRVLERSGEKVIDGRNSGRGSFTVLESPRDFPRWHSAEGAVVSLDRTGDVFRIEIDHRDQPEVTLRFRTSKVITMKRAIPGAEDQAFRSQQDGDLQVVRIPGSHGEITYTLTVGGGS